MFFFVSKLKLSHDWDQAESSIISKGLCMSYQLTRAIGYMFLSYLIIKKPKFVKYLFLIEFYLIINIEFDNKLLDFIEN